MINNKVYITLIVLCLINFYFYFFNNKISKLLNLFDHPDGDRKIHKSPIALTGGLFIFLNIIIIFIVMNFYQISRNIIFEKEILFFLTLFFILGFYDDKFSISSNLKLFISTIFFLLFALVNQNFILQEIIFTTGHVVNLGLFAIPFTLFCLVIFQNAFNMFDGINLQNILYFILFIFSINFFYNKIDFLIYLIPVLILIVCMNAKNYLFLGDSGSYTLSFIMSVLLIDTFNNSKAIFSDEVFLLLCIPGYDLLRLTVIRILNKKHPFEGDRMHIHHLLINKIGYIKSIIYLNLICYLPIVYSYITNQNLIAILITLILYIITIYHFRNEKKN